MTAANPEGPNYGTSSIAHDLGEQYRQLFKTVGVVIPKGRGPDGEILVADVPEGRELVSLKKFLDEYLLKPERRAGTALLSDAESFIAHVLRFASANSVVFAVPDPKAPRLVSVLDYHPVSADATQADWLQHRGVYAPELSDPWKAWMLRNGQPMNQADFAGFIEEHITDVIVPMLDDPNLMTFAQLVQGRFADPSELLGLSRSLSINIETAVKNAVTLSTGEIAVRYEETHKDGEGAPIQVANLFQVCIPVFYGGPLYRIAVRLRYKPTGQRIMWSYLLVRPDVVFDTAFKGIIAKVRIDAGVPVFLGAPETVVR